MTPQSGVITPLYLSPDIAENSIVREFCPPFRILIITEFFSIFLNMEILTFSIFVSYRNGPPENLRFFRSVPAALHAPVGSTAVPVALYVLVLSPPRDYSELHYGQPTAILLVGIPVTGPSRYDLCSPCPRRGMGISRHFRNSVRFWKDSYCKSV